jgi:hypothetical protein
MSSNTQGSWRQGLRLLACAVFGMLLLGAAPAAQAKPIKFVIQFTYICGMDQKIGCNGVTEQVAHTTFTADDQAVTDLTAQSGGTGKGILESFSIMNSGMLARDTTFACADGSPLRFDPTAVYFYTGGTTYKTGLSCANATISGNGLTFNLTKPFSGGTVGGAINAPPGKLFVTGRYVYGLPGLIVRSYEANSINALVRDVVLQKGWDACQFAGFTTTGPADNNGPDGCVLTGSPGGPYTLSVKRAISAQVITCSAICTAQE